MVCDVMLFDELDDAIHRTVLHDHQHFSLHLERNSTEMEVVVQKCVHPLLLGLPVCLELILKLAWINLS